MHAFQGFRKSGSALRRHSYALSLEAALAELFRLYDGAGGALEGAGAALAGWIEQGAAAQPGPDGAGRLSQALRTRDLHEFVTRDPAHESLKLAILEQLLFRRDPAQRWAAVRPLLLEALPALSGSGSDAPRASLEPCKRALSDPDSPAGELLVLVALFNFDADPELPPENWAPRFRRGRFPRHDWEPIGQAAGTMDWRPGNPLCRWEYLAADLLHAHLTTGTGAARPAPLREAGTLGGRKDAAFSLHCRMEPPPGGDAGAGQLSLLPVDPAAFAAELQRTVHRKAGAEGVRLLALLLGRLARLPEGQTARLDPAELLAGTAEPARVLRERARKLLQVLALICDVELQRVEHEDGRTAVRLSRFLTVLGREGECASGPDAAGAALDDPLALRLHVAVDPLFWRGGGGTLGDAYRDLPLAVLNAPAREHPLLVGLAAWLPGAWERAWEQTGGVVQRGIEQVFTEAGLWLRDSERYRAAEHLKRDLTKLQELGVLGQWRLVRGAGRGVLDQDVRLSAPQRDRRRPAPSNDFSAERAAPRDVRGWA